MDFTKDNLTIDETRLDKEWLTQPQRFYEVAIQVAESRRKMERTKAALELVQAEIDREIRESPINFGLHKVTEAVVANTIKSDKRYIDLQELLIEARFEVNAMEAFREAMEQRKRALEGLVQLHGQNYFSVPRDSSGGAADVIEKGKQRTQKRVNERLNKKGEDE